MTEHRLAETLSWLYSLESRGEIYKLERMELALSLIGDPHHKLRAVHIAGTKGKGSVAAMLDSCLRAAGYKVGLYTKPHLVNLSERTRINGCEINSARMLAYIERLRTIFEGAGLGLTFFEFTVALMFLYFAEEHVDIAIIETGLGGRLDSTNVLRPMLSVITPIGFDHMEYLGYTIPSIASEKGGIIKPGVPVVIGARDTEARDTLTSIATQRRSAARLIDRDFSFTSRAPEHAIDFRGFAMDLPDLELGLAGSFQHENAAVAAGTLEALRSLGWRIDEESIRRGMREVYWPGRFDIVRRNPTVIIDGAHNEMSIRALLDTISSELGDGVRFRLIFGCQETKNWREMASMLIPRSRDATLTMARPKRPLDPFLLARAFEPHIPARVEPDATRAISTVMGECTAQDMVLITGSVYLIGEIYSYFLAREGRRGLFPEAET